MSFMRSLAVPCLAATLLCCVPAANAQAQAADASKPILQTVTRFQNNLMSLAQAMPADKYGFAPANGMFKAGTPAQFDTVRTFAQQLTHLASLPFRILAPFGVKPDPGVDPKSFDSLTSKDDILKALQASFDYENKVIGTLTPENAFTPTGPRGATLVAALMMVMNDDGDHYGQMVEYLRMNGIVPPASEHQMQNMQHH